MGYLTLGWLTLPDVAPADVVGAAAAGGFESVGLRITGRHLTDSDYPVVGYPAAMRDIRRRLADTGLRLSNISTYHLYPEVTLDHLAPVIDATAELGASTIVVTCMDPDEARWTAFAARCCERAAEAGVKLALEFVPYSCARDLAQARRIVRAARQPNFGLLVDPLHLARSGGGPGDLSRLEPGLIFFAQLCDAARDRPPAMDLATEARAGRLYPGDGGLPLHAFLDALPADIEIELEIPRGDQAGLAPGERARQAGEAARRFFADHRSTTRTGKPPR
jgi:sugar phosphate isomerase/epimerase